MLAEKAYIQASGQDSYSFINEGNSPSVALTAITGGASSDHDMDPASVVSAWNQGLLIVIMTDKPTDTNLPGNHSYALIGVFLVYNPWGTGPAFSASYDYIKDQFDVYSVCT